MQNNNPTTNIVREAMQIVSKDVRPPKITKDLAFFKTNCEEDYLHTPISVLRYITELEKRIL